MILSDGLMREKFSPHCAMLKDGGTLGMIPSEWNEGIFLGPMSNFERLFFFSDIKTSSPSLCLSSYFIMHFLINFLSTITFYCDVTSLKLPILDVKLFRPTPLVLPVITTGIIKRYSRISGY